MIVNIIEYYKIARIEDLGIESVAKALGIGKMEALRKIEYFKKPKIGDMSLKGFKVIIDWKQLSFGQFISIESMLSSHSTEEGKMLHLCKCLFRPEGEVVFDNEDEEREDKNVSNILKLPYWKVVPLLEKAMESRSEFHKMFKGAFYEEPDNLEELEEDEDRDVEPVEAAPFERKWFWYALIDEIAGGDVARHSDIMDLNIMIVAPKVAYETSKAKAEAERARRAKAEMDAKSRAR